MKHCVPQIHYCTTFVYMLLYIYTYEMLCHFLILQELDLLQSICLTYLANGFWRGMVTKIYLTVNINFLDVNWSYQPILNIICWVIFLDTQALYLQKENTGHTLKSKTER